MHAFSLSSLVLCIYSTYRCSILEEWDSLLVSLNASLYVTRGSCTPFIHYRQVVSSPNSRNSMAWLYFHQKHRCECTSCVPVSHIICQQRLTLPGHAACMHIGHSYWHSTLVDCSCSRCLVIILGQTMTIMAFKHPEWPLTAETLQWGKQ